MIIILNENAKNDEVENLTAWLKENNVQVSPIKGEQKTILGLVGDTTQIDMGLINSLDIVENVQRVSAPFKRANRAFHPESSVIEITPDVKIGGGNLQVIAGPCSVESKAQIIEVARRVKQAGATIIRGGAFKPRTSPYSFQGLGSEGLDLLRAAREDTGLPICTEIMHTEDLPLFEDIDILQIGARNTQNYNLLKAVGKTQKPILLKRGIAGTIDELLMSAEYIMSEGNPNVILCERGIRTYEQRTRNTLDISAVPVLHNLTHLPVVVDPSHGTGYSELVPPMALASTAAGADGLIIEVHNNPSKALSDGGQSLTPDQFDDLMPRIELIRQAIS